MSHAKLIFDRLESGLAKILLKNGFVLSETAHDEEHFGSRFSIWKNEKENYAVRLTWDGKEAWFIVEESPFSADGIPVSWADCVIAPFDKNVNEERYFQEIVDEVLNKFS